MEPALPAGSFVLVRKTNSVKPDDIIAVKYGDQILIKRITEIKNNQLWLVGDNKNDSYDSRTIGWIDTKNTVGKIIWY